MVASSRRGAAAWAQPGVVGTHISKADKRTCCGNPVNKRNTPNRHGLPDLRSLRDRLYVYKLDPQLWFSYRSCFRQSMEHHAFDVIAGVYMQNFAGYAARKFARHEQCSAADFICINSAPQRCFFDCLIHQFIEMLYA